MIDSGNGYVTSWNEGTISPFSYNVFSEISSNTTWDDSTTLPLTRYDLTSNAILTLDNADFNISDLSVYNGSLVIEPSASIDISGTLTIFTSGTVTAKSNSLESASLITNSRSGPGSTNFYYEKYVAANDTTNDLIAPPFAGLSFTNTLANNPGVIKQDPSDSTKYLFGPFDNDNGIYLTYDSDTDGNQTMGVGKGYRVGTISGGGTVTFRGLFQNGNVGVLTSKGGHNLYGRWNLIGNPFACYIDLNHFFDDNKTKIESGTYNAVYAYDGDDSDGSVWTIYNGNNSSGQYIAPGQAFFVAVDSNKTLIFDHDMKTVTGGDDFLPGERRPNDDSFAQNASSSNSKISLALSFDDSKYVATDIYLNTKASSGLDVGYDAGTFANQAGSLGLYSFLADGSHPETKLAIQAVSNNISDPVVIPLGVNAQSGIDYTIKLKERPQQEGVFIYLKDKLDNSMTLLTDQDYSFNTSTDLQGDGRFEVHLSAFALSTFDISKAPYSMIGLSGKVQVTGELSKGDVITILDLRGRTLAKQTVNSPTQSTTVQLNGVSKGVYIGKVENNIGQYNTKFILK